MTDISHKHVRDTRDRLTDLLGIGRTFPLRDLDVKDERLTVPFDAAAKIPIEISQVDVLYSLFQKDGSPVNRVAEEPAEARGNGETLILDTPAILEDVTYDIRAARIKGTKIDPKSVVYLHQTATVKVGLDVSLEAEILEAELLDPTIDSPTQADPRIVNYGNGVDILLKESQEGVDYRPVVLVKANGASEFEEVALSDTPVRGTRDDIVLHVAAVHEDVDIRIRALKTFDPAEGRPDQTDLLDVVLPLKVRANKANAVTAAPANIVDFRQNVTIIIADSQVSATYRIYQRILRDRNFFHGDFPEDDLIRVRVPDEPDVQISKPLLPSVWQVPEGYLPVGDFKSGNGSDLELPLEAMTEDSLIIVQAQKEHLTSVNGQDTSKLPSAVPLQQSAVILVRPDPAPEIGLRVPVEGNSTGRSLRVFNGQPGVFYYLRDSRDGKDIGLPAYFHQRDDHNDQLNKGLGQLKIEVDLVPATDPIRDDAEALTDPATEVPQPPLIEISPVTLDAELELHAVKAQTRVSASLTQTASIPAGPKVTALSPIVDHGGTTRIRIKASRVDEVYQLIQEGKAPGNIIEGNGNNRNLNTGPLTHDTRFELLVTRPDIPVVVVRVISVTVQVRPDPSLTVRQIENAVDPDTSTRIQIEASQQGVLYRLMVGETAVGEAMEGNGSIIELPTGPVAADTTFSIQATRADAPEISVVLNEQVQITIRTG